jgi:hypothetical protein
MPSDIEVFQKYAKRMTNIRYNNRGGAVEVEEALVQSITSRPLFPNLHKLTAVRFERDANLLADMFFGTKLDTIELYDLHSISGPSLMRQVQSRCPSIKRMRLGYKHNPGPMQATSNIVFEFGGLESLALPSLALPDLIRVSAFSTLRDLQVHKVVAGDTGPMPGSVHTHLTRLQLGTMEDVLLFNEFLSSCRPHQLQMLALTSPVQSPSSQWQQCFQTLSLYCSTTLETLIIEAFAEEVTVLSNTVLAPLLTLQNLTHLRIHCSFEHLDDHELKRMALAWPHLQELRLLPYGTSFEVLDTEVTLVGILPLLEHCSKLKELWLPMNVSQDCIHLPDRPWRDICNRNITYIAVGNTIMENPIAAAIFFFHVLPNLRSIDSWDDVDEDEAADGRNRARWKEVCSLMEHLRMVGFQDVVWGPPKKDMKVALIS